ncbi:MAG: gluconokinase, partial [Candidatus Xenobia bacterium]
GAGNPLTPLYTWADTRCRPAVAVLKQKLDASAVHQRTGCLIHESYLPAKLLWLGNPYGVRRWISPGELITWQLFGEPVCSLSMASATGLLDQAHQDWDDEVLAACGVARSALNPVSARVLQGLREPYRSRLAPLADVPWLPAVGDGACSNFGCGAVSGDRIAVMLGTSGAVRRMTEKLPEPVPEGLWRYALDARRWLVGGAVSNGGNVYEWVHKMFRVGDAAPVSEPDAHGLTVLPHLAGERSPHWNGDARAAIVGLSLATRPVDVLQAAMEAVTYTLADIWQRLDAPDAQAIATGAALVKSPRWTAMLADVLGCPVTLSEEAEASSRGVALLVLEHLGISVHPGVPGTEVTPNPAHHERYRVARARYEALYNAIMK